MFTDLRALQVLALGRQIAGLESERRHVIEEIRLTARVAEQEAALSAARAAQASAAQASAAQHVAPPTAAPGAVSSAPAIPAPASPVVSPAPAPAVPLVPVPGAADVPPVIVQPAPPRPPRRRLTVPVLLLIVGVSLVGVAAIFFLLLAWFVAGIAVRALIIGGITLAAMAAASWLRRRSLTATAEAIAVLGVILVALDAWAVRANDLFGAGAVRGAVYAGAAALVVAVVCRGWAVLSKLRAPDLAAAVAFPAGVGLLLTGLLGASTVESAVAGLLGASAAGLAHALPRPWASARRGADAQPERIALALIGIAALAGAAVTAAVALVEVPAIIWSAVGIVALGASHTWAARLRTGAESLLGSGVLSGIAASIAVAEAGAAAWLLAVRTGESIYPVLIAPVVAGAVAVGMDVVRGRVSRLEAPAITAGVVGAMSLAVFIIGGLWDTQRVIDDSWTLWRTAPFALPASPTDLPLVGLLTAVVLSVLVFASPTLRRPAIRDLRPFAVAILVIVGAARSAVPALAVGASVLLVAVSVWAITRKRSQRAWAGAGALAAASGFLFGVADPWLWFVAVAVAVALPVAVRAALPATGTTAVVLALAPVAVATIAAIMAPAPLAVLLGVPTGFGVTAGAVMALVQWVALMTLLASVMVRIDAPSRAATTLAGEALLAVALIGTFTLTAAGAPATSAIDAALQTQLGEPVAGVVRGALVAACLVAVIALHRRTSLPAAVAAAGLLAPTLAASVHALLRGAGAASEVWAPLLLMATAVLVVVLAAWTGVTERWGGASRAIRVAAELGAAVAGVVAAWSISSEQAWAGFALAAVGVAAAAVTKGWAAPQTTPEDDVFASLRAGVPLARAPRRLLVWPATAAAVLSWWSWLGAGTPETTFTVETTALPVGAALVGVAAVLVRLRRRVEASLALALGMAIGLGAPALASWDGDTLRGTLVALAATVVCAALSVPPLRRVRPVAVAGAAVALAAVAIVTLERAVTGGAPDAAWLLLLVGAAFGSALGHARATPSRMSSHAYAASAPASALVLAGAAVAVGTDHPVVTAVALAALALVHIAAAAADRVPLGAVSRWASLAAAVIVTIGALFFGVFDEVEAVTLPLAGIVLAGAAVAGLRSARRAGAWPVVEVGLWIAGLVIATVPSITADAEPVRVWLFLAATLAAAATASIAPIPDSWRIRVPSALVLAGAALTMGARAFADPAFATGDAAAVTAAAGAMAIAIVLASTAPAERTARHPIALAAAGAAVLDAVVVLRFDGELVPAVIAVAVGGAVAVVGAASLALIRWRGVGAVLALGGLALVLSVCGIRFAAVAAQPGLEPDLWALVGAAIVVGVVIAALRAVPTAGMGRAGGAVLAAAAVLFALAESALLVAQDGFGDVRALVSMTTLSAAAVAGMLLRRRLGWSLAVAAMVAAAAFGLFAIVGFGVAPVELVTAPPAVAGLAYGAWILRRDADARSWPVLGPWIALLTLPSLAYDFDETELWRVVALGAVAIALVVAGAVLRLQAPLVLGSAVLIAHGLAQLWPWISAVYVAVPWWLWLGIGGALLIFLAATYERRMRQMKAAFGSITSLR